ncbi:MAG TPA: NAD-dependent epimerase/dehydratase family protein [bacterium]|nr:NAD-dependent epimerase/dehydratase family protein [bacterium]
MLMYVVTGASGHVGNTLIRMLIEQGKGDQVVAMIHCNKEPESLKGLAVKKVCGDICDYQSLVPLFKGADVVFHCAALISIVPGMYKKLNEVNYDGTINVMRACREAGVRRLVHVASIEAIGDVCKDRPVNEEDGFNPEHAMIEYGITKANAALKVVEEAAKGLDVVIVSPVGVVGPYDFKPSQMGKMVQDYAAKKLPAYPDGGFDFVDVRDVAKAILAAAEKGRTGHNYLVTGGHLSIPEMMAMLEEVSGIRKPLFKLPHWLLTIAALGSEGMFHLFGGNPVLTRGSLRILKSRMKVCGEKTRRELGVEPTPLRKTFADQIEFFRSHGMIPPA